MSLNKVHSNTGECFKLTTMEPFSVLNRLLFRPKLESLYIKKIKNEIKKSNSRFSNRRTFHSRDESTKLGFERLLESSAHVKKVVFKRSKTVRINLQSDNLKQVREEISFITSKNAINRFFKDPAKGMFIKSVAQYHLMRKSDSFKNKSRFTLKNLTPTKNSKKSWIILKKATINDVYYQEFIRHQFSLYKRNKALLNELTNEIEFVFNDEKESQIKVLTALIILKNLNLPFAKVFKKISVSNRKTHNLFEFKCKSLLKKKFKIEEVATNSKSKKRLNRNTKAIRTAKDQHLITGVSAKSKIKHRIKEYFKKKNPSFKIFKIDDDKNSDTLLVSDKQKSFTNSSKRLPSIEFNKIKNQPSMVLHKSTFRERSLFALNDQSSNLTDEIEELSLKKSVTNRNLGLHVKVHKATNNVIPSNTSDLFLGRYGFKMKSIRGKFSSINDSHDNMSLNRLDRQTSIRLISKKEKSASKTNKQDDKNSLKIIRYGTHINNQMTNKMKRNRSRTVKHSMNDSSNKIDSVLFIIKNSSKRNRTLAKIIDQERMNTGKENESKNINSRYLIARKLKNRFTNKTNKMVYY